MGELEEQIKQMEEDNELEVTGFKNQIANLSREVEQCRHEISWWRNRCHALEKEVDLERSAKEALAKELRPSSGNNALSSGRASPRPSTQISSHVDRQMDGSNNPNSSSNNNESEQEEVPLGCSRCSLSHCQCIEDVFAMSNIDTGSGVRDHQRSETQIKPEPEEMEIDFTARFSGSQILADVSTSVSSPAVDPCGFCQDGTPCICAEMAAHEEQRQKRQRRDSFDSHNRLAPIQSISQFTPPPSDSDAHSEVTLPPISQATNPCANGPGTCAQCQADPRSTLFCKSLAASRSVTSAPAGCCGGKGAGGGCCQSRGNQAGGSGSNQTSTTSSSSGGTVPALTLSCADAFTTLSRHPNFSRATDELGTWLPRLHTLPKPQDLAGDARLSSRPAMEVEAASVMGVLRYFDRRFADK